MEWLDRIEPVFSFTFHHSLEIFLGIGLGVQALGALSMIRFYFKRPRPLPLLKDYPGITIIKPCYGINENEEENFLHFFLQKYAGPIQLLFVVSNEGDPVVPVIKNYLRQFPDFDAELVISRTRTSFRRKVDALFDGHALAKHDFILWSDSDVIVRENYIEQVVASLLEPGVAIVTTPQYDLGVNNFTSALKVMANNCDIGTYITLDDWISSEKKYAWGHSLAFRLKEFKEIEVEAWDIMNRFLADDQSLPFLYNKYHKKTVIKNIYCPVHCGKKTWKEMITQRERWAVCQRLVFPNRFVYLFLLLFYPQISATLLLFHHHFDSWSVLIFFSVAAFKILISFQFELLFLRSARMTTRYFWTICLADLMQIYFFTHAFLSRSIQFHGKKYRVKDRYFIEEITN